MKEKVKKVGKKSERCSGW